MSYELIHGDCLEVLPTLTGVDAIVTSPPYAEQRKKFYHGIPEADYPDWTVAWMDGVAKALRPDGSVLINIREHVKDGQISDYVHKTRLAVRAAGWYECDELIWIKSAAPPVGHPGRPRRSWERILWFSRSNQPWCDPKANGKPSKQVGMTGGNRHGITAQVKAGIEGVARCPDYASFATRLVANGIDHPAAYPVALAEWMMRLVCRPGGLVVDPFMGSGTTGVACLQTGRRFIGIEKDARYFEIAQERIQRAAMQTRLAV